MAAVYSVRSYHAVFKSRSFTNMGLLRSVSHLCSFRPLFLTFYPKIKTYEHYCKFSSHRNCRLSAQCLPLNQLTKLCTVMEFSTSFHYKQQQQPQQEQQKEIDTDKVLQAGYGRPTKSSPPPNSDFQARVMKYTLLGFGLIMSAMSGFMVMAWGQEPIDDKGVKLKDEYSDMPKWKAYLQRTWRELNYYDRLIKDPSREKLLPDPLTEPYYQPPYTLVMELTGVLVHPDWTYKTGWRFKKRPAVDFFLQQVASPLYEVVIYTSEQGFTAFPIIDTLDPNGYIMYRLFRDATRYTKGHHIKDLGCLNRDLSKVIFIDWNEKSFQLQPENALKLKKWQGNDEDRSLIDLAAFLRTVATSQVDDVRPVLTFYKQFDDPLAAFKANQQRLQEEQSRMASAQGDFADRSLSWTRSFFKRWQQ